MVCGNNSDFIDHPLPKHFASAHRASHNAWGQAPHHLNPALVWPQSIYQFSNFIRGGLVTSTSNGRCEEEIKNGIALTRVFYKAWLKEHQEILCGGIFLANRSK